MEILVRKADKDLVEIKHAIFDKAFCTELTNFFIFLTSGINATCNVTDIQYKGNILAIEKYDFFDDYFYIENYIFDEALINDSKFMESINSLLKYFNQVRDTLRPFVDSCIKLKKEKNECANQARRIFKEYCKTGNFTLPEDKSNLEKIYEMFESCALELFVYFERDKNGTKQKCNTVELSELDSTNLDSEDTMTILRNKAKEIATILREECFGTGDDGIKVFSKKEKVAV